jgi:hypothetical protein
LKIRGFNGECPRHPDFKNKAKKLNGKKIMLLIVTIYDKVV